MQGDTLTIFTADLIKNQPQKMVKEAPANKSEEIRHPLKWNFIRGL